MRPDTSSVATWSGCANGWNKRKYYLCWACLPELVQRLPEVRKPELRSLWEAAVPCNGVCLRINATKRQRRTEPLPRRMLPESEALPPVAGG